MLRAARCLRPRLSTAVAILAINKVRCSDCPWRENCFKGVEFNGCSSCVDDQSDILKIKFNHMLPVCVKHERGFCKTLSVYEDQA